MASLRRLSRAALSQSISSSAGPRLLGPADVRELAERHSFHPSKQRGQNFVIDPNTVRRIVRTAELDRSDVVLEVGPGFGSLTLAMLDAVSQVTAIEVDAVLAGALAATVAERAPSHADRLTVVHGDALQVESVPHPLPTVVVANLPYNVAVPVLLHLLAWLPSVRRVLVMVQLEVADRLVASPGSKIYGVPSVKAAWFGKARRVGVVGRTVFWPAPRVDSGLVALDRQPPPLSRVGRESVFEVVDAAFGQRRKMLRTALAGLAGSPSRVEAVLEAAGVDPTSRGERLSIADFVRIADCLGPPS